MSYLRIYNIIFMVGKYVISWQNCQEYLMKKKYIL